LLPSLQAPLDQSFEQSLQKQGASKRATQVQLNKDLGKTIDHLITLDKNKLFT
jgi:hypothetical protein